MASDVPALDFEFELNTCHMTEIRALCVSDVPLGACSHTKSCVQVQPKKAKYNIVHGVSFAQVQGNTLNLTCVLANT